MWGQQEQPPSQWGSVAQSSVTAAAGSEFPSLGGQDGRSSGGAEDESVGAAGSGTKVSSLATLAEKVSMGESIKRANRVDIVKVDGLVLLKIIKHATESLPEFCSGSLLGMDVDTTLEVTNCFPSIEEERAEEGSTSPPVENPERKKYMADMLKLLRDINIDTAVVGWYRSAYMGSFCTMDMVEQLFEHQEELDNKSVQRSVVLVYDPFQTKKGNLALKAFRLTDTFLKMMREKKAPAKGALGPRPVKLSAAVIQAIGGLKSDGSAIEATSESDLSAEDIFEEVPIEITNAHLFTVLLEDFKESNGDRIDVDFDRLNLSTNPYLETNFEFLVEEVDNLANEQSRQQKEKRKIQQIEQDQIRWIQQRRMENRAREERGEPLLPEDGDPNLGIFKPQTNVSQLESLLIRKQIGVYCDQINKFTGSGFSKLYLSAAIQKGNEPQAN